MPSSPKLAGFQPPNGHHGPGLGTVAVRPLSTQWLSDEQIAETRRVWSKAYGRVISDEEAIEILNTAYLAGRVFFCEDVNDA